MFLFKYFKYNSFKVKKYYISTRPCNFIIIKKSNICYIYIICRKCLTSQLFYVLFEFSAFCDTVNCFQSRVIKMSLADVSNGI